MCCVRGRGDGAGAEEGADAGAEVEDEEVRGFPGGEDGGAVVALDLCSVLVYICIAHTCGKSYVCVCVC